MSKPVLLRKEVLADPQRVRSAISHGADVNVTHRVRNPIKNGFTPLRYAAKYGYTESVEVLLAAGARARYPRSFRESALHFACREDSTEMLEAILRHKIFFEGALGDALIWCAELGGLQHVRRLLDAGADANACTTLFNITALHEACELGRGAVIEALIGAGAHLDKRDYKSRTPLDLSVMGGHYEAAEMLLAAGANPEGVLLEETADFIQAYFNTYAADAADAAGSCAGQGPGL